MCSTERKNPKGTTSNGSTALGILDCIRSGLIVLSHDLRIIHANSIAEHLLDIPHDLIIGRNLSDIPKLTNFPNLVTHCSQVLESKLSMELCLPNIATGEWFDLRISTYDSGIYILMDDITEQRRASQLIRATDRINDEINSSHDLDEIMRTVIADASNAIHAEGGAVLLLEKGRWIARYKHNLTNLEIGTRLGGKGVPLPDPVTYENVSAISCMECDEGLSGYLGIKRKPRTLLSIPLVIKNELIGAYLFCCSREGIILTEQESQFAQRLGFSTSMAIENSRLNEEIKRERRKIWALQRISEAGVSSLSLEEALETIIRNITNFLDASYGVLMYIIDERKNEYTRVEHIASPEKALCENISDELANMVCQEGRMVRIDSEEDNFTLFGSPLIVRGSVRGAVFICVDKDRVLTAEDLEMLELMLSRSSLVIDNVQLYSDLSSSKFEIQKALDKERGISHLLERALMPALPALDESYIIADEYFPLRDNVKIGGDFYDLFIRDDGSIGIVMGDVSGKGVNAASLAVAARSTIRAFAHNDRSPASVLQRTNDVLCTHYIEDYGTFITVFLIDLDPSTGIISCSGAGHPPAIIRRKNGDIEFICSVQPPLGIFKPLRFCEVTERLYKGDKLVLYTDGITEARGRGGFFGIEGIRNVLCEYGSLPPDIVASKIIEAASKWAGGVLRDDTALIVIERADQ